MVQVRLAVLVGTHQAATHATAVVERTRNITFGTVVVPGPCAGGDRRLEVLSGLLAHQVDRRRGVARAGHQAGRTLDDFDAVIGGHVDVGHALIVDAVVDGVDAIVLVVGNGKPAGGVLHAFAVVSLNRNPGRVAQHVADVLRAMVVDHLAGDYADRLRRFAQGQRQLGCAGRTAGGVGAGTLGDVTQPQGIDAAGG
ncbi:hypothetical protein D3C81_1122270 [compost metagenome]